MTIQDAKTVSDEIEKGAKKKLNQHDTRMKTALREYFKAIRYWLLGFLVNALY